MFWRKIIMLLAEWWTIPTRVGCLKCALRKTAVTSIDACCYLSYFRMKCTEQINVFTLNSRNQQTWHHTVTFEKVKWRGNITKQIRGGMCVLCNVISVRKPLIPNRCVLHNPAVNYMCDLWSDSTPTLLNQILYVTSTHKCHINCLILSGYGVTDTAHNAQCVHLKSGVGVHKFPHFSRHPIQYLNEQFLDSQAGFGGTRNSMQGLLCLILLQFCVWGYLKNMMHERKVNTSKKNAARFMNDTDIWSRVTCSLAREVRMCIHTMDGNSMYMNLISVQVNYVWKMNFNFQISTAPQHFESDLWLYNVSDWERH